MGYVSICEPKLMLTIVCVLNILANDFVSFTITAIISSFLFFFYNKGGIKLTETYNKVYVLQTKIANFVGNMFYSNKVPKATTGPINNGIDDSITLPFNTGPKDECKLLTKV